MTVRDAASSDAVVKVLGSPGNSVPEASLVAARAADAKQGSNTVVLAMGELLVLTDAFVLTSGRNSRQVHSIVEEVEEVVKAETSRSPVRIEGLKDLTWVLMDYGDFLVHVFLEETRAFYDIERLWGNALHISWGGADEQMNAPALSNGESIDQGA